MKSFEIKPTEENLILTLNEDLLHRNQKLVQLYKTIASQESSTAIAIDGRWGSGKTFFVRQLMLIINAMNPVSNYDWEKREKILDGLTFKESKDSDTCNLAVYYDAWKNDNDTEPVISLIYEIAKDVGLSFNVSNERKLFEIAVDILDNVTRSNLSEIIKTLKSNDPITELKKQKDLEDKFGEFFKEVLEERGNKLIIFIDELDRCNPRFAVRLLEQIKHYFCNDNIVFVFSINFEELQHTIKHYYGNDFNGFRYLDRFFDMRIVLPSTDKRSFLRKMGLNGSDTIDKVILRFIDVFNLEIRETIRYYQQVRILKLKTMHEIAESNITKTKAKAHEFMVIYIVPVLIGLRIVDINKYYQFIEGRNGQILVDVFNTTEFIGWFYDGLLNPNKSSVEDDKLDESKNAILSIYITLYL